MWRPSCTKAPARGTSICRVGQPCTGGTTSPVTRAPLRFCPGARGFAISPFKSTRLRCSCVQMSRNTTRKLAEVKTVEVSVSLVVNSNGHVGKVNLLARRAGAASGQVAVYRGCTVSAFYQQPRLTRQTSSVRWFQPTLEKKRRVMRNGNSTPRYHIYMQTGLS